MRDFRKLKVWERSHKLTLGVYRVTESFPASELYGLTSQLRRGAASVPANIAEGAGRNGDVELARFLDIAMGSASELDYHLLLSRDLGYIPVRQSENLQAEALEIKRMLGGLIHRLRDGTSKRVVAKSQS
jgi:four helix bundle protein